MLWRANFLLLAAALTCASCGLKGPLYLPDEPRDAVAAPTEEDGSATTRKKQGESSVAPPAIDPDRPADPPGR